MTDYPSNMGEWARMADNARAAAKTPAERATYARIALAARSTGAELLSPEAQAAFGRVSRAFQQLDADAAARSAEIQDTLTRNVEAMAPSAAPITNSNFSLLRGRLPEAVQAKLDRLEDQLAEVRALRSTLTQDQQHLMTDRGEIISKIRINTEKDVASRYGITVLMDESHPTLKRLRADQALLDKRLEKINEKLASSKPRFEAMDRLQEGCRAYVRYLLGHSVQFALHDSKAAKKQASGDLIQTLADIRQKIEEIRAQLRTHRDRPRRSVDVKEKVAAFIKTRARPVNVMDGLDHGGNLHWPIIGVRGRTVDQQVAGSEYDVPAEFLSSVGSTEDTLGIMCWLNPDAITRAIEDEIDRYSDDANALGDEDRARGEAEMLAKLLIVEREEELLVQVAEEREMQVYRRGDADPRTVLGLASNLPPMLEAA
jgi:hypothetical protein